MVSADDVALEQRPNALNAIDVIVEVLHILLRAVVDAMMMETPLQANKANMLVGHHICARRNDVSDSTLDVVGAQIGNRASNKVATTL